jgi:predicted RNA-binding protein with PUA-like domain
MAYWLLKTEPSSYSFADLRRARRTRWDGVTNPQALGHLRSMAVGDGIAVYHSGDREVAGLARVARAAYPDPGHPSTGRAVVDVEAAGPLASPVPLEALKGEPTFAGSPLLRQGRLSVVPLTAAQWKAILRLGATRP